MPPNRSSLNQISPFYLFLLLLVALFPSANKVTVAEEAGDLIQHAETYYWIGLSEQGNIKAFEKGLSYLSQAEALSTPEDQRKIESLKNDLEMQMEMAKGTFLGRFPLVKLIGVSVFTDIATTGSYEIVYDPSVSSMSAALGDVIESVSIDFMSSPQLDVVVRSIPDNSALDNEAFYVLNNVARFSTHPTRDVVSALSPDQYSQFRQSDLSPETLDTLCQNLGIQQLLVITIEQLDIVDDNYFYGATGEVYEVGNPKPIYTVGSDSIIQDRRMEIPLILLAHLILLLLAIGIYLIAPKLEGDSRPLDLVRDGAVVIISFITGRIMPWFLVPTINAIQPEAEIPILYTFWWAGLVGVLLLLIPILIYRVANARLMANELISGVLGDFNLDGRGGGICTAISLGCCAYLSSALFLYFRATAYQALVPVVMTGGLMGYILGRAIDKTDLPIVAGVLPAVVSLVYGMAICSADLTYLWTVAIVSSVAGMYLLWRHGAGPILDLDVDYEEAIAGQIDLSQGFCRGDLRDIIQLIERLIAKRNPLSEYLFNALDDDDQRSLIEYQQSQEELTITAPPLSIQIVLVNLLNAQLENPDLYTKDRFKEIQLSAYASDLIEKASSVELRNRQLLLESFRSELKDPATRVIPKDVEGLKRCCAQPSYVYSKNYHQSLQLLKPVLSGQSTFLTMSGSSGMGKTATTNALIETIQFETQLSGQEFVLLSGKCPQPFAGQDAEQDAPYAPFQEALSKVFNINLLAPADAQLEQLDAALDGIFDSAVPFAGLLFPSSEESFNTAGSNKELFVSIERTLKQLLETGRRTSKVVLVFIDDIQWIDESSKELLEHLVTAFREDSQTSIAFLLTSREEEVALDVGLSADEIYQVSHEVGEESRRDHISILSDSLNLTSPIAESIVDKVGDINNHQGALYWLCQIVVDLTDMKAFQLKDGGFSWTPDYEQYQDPETALPVPSELRDSIVEQLEKHPEYLPILECAACLGLQFPADVLAASLATERLILLKQLAEMEQTTNFIYDVREEDDIYSFRSSIMLEVIRERIQIMGRGPRSSDVPQIVREYHTRVAEALIERPNVDIFAVARHYYAAGSSSAADGMKYCLQAAQAAVQQPAVNEAREYIKMARECANVAGLDEEGQDFITLECHLAHISGEHRAEMAQKCMDYLEIETDPTPDFLMIATRSCYDGAMDQRDQKLFTKAVELGEQLANHPQAKPTDQADGFHFIGLSLSPTEADQRKQNLSRAFDLLTDFDTEDIPGQALLARIANSFALQLEREDPAEASRLYQQSVDIKNRPELRDINGLAISHNGLGRIHIFGQPSNPAQARYHFEISLEFAERIGSAIGICKSSSFLGMCAKTEEKHDDAVEYYQRSYDYAQGSFDRGFAAAGLLESLCNVQDLERMNEFGPLFLAQITTDGEVPGPIISAITEALDRCQEHSSADWLTELRSMIPETSA